MGSKKSKLEPSSFSQINQIVDLNKPFKIVLNKKFGGWGLSLEAIKWLIKNKDINFAIIVDGHINKNKKLLVDWVRYSDKTIDLYLDFDLETFESYSKNPDFRHALDGFIANSWHFNVDFPMSFLRNHPYIVECVEILGSKRASGPSSNLQIEEILFRFDLEDNDGMESIAFY
jgi:hypothetical protein